MREGGEGEREREREREKCYAAFGTPQFQLLKQLMCATLKCVARQVDKSHTDGSKGFSVDQLKGYNFS